MAKLNEELKSKLEFIKEYRVGEMDGNAVIHTTYKGIYRQYQYYEPENASDLDKAQEEEFAKNVLTQTINRELERL